MQMPEIPFTPTDLANDRPVADNLTPLPFSICNSGLLSPVSRKHERAEDDDIHSRPLLKRMMTMTEAEHLSGYYAMDNLRTYSGGASITVTEKATSRKATSDDRPEQALSEGGSPILQSSVMNSAHRRIITRDFMRDLVTEALRSGHPISQVHNETDSGEIIEVKTINSRGEPQDQTIHLNIESEVPEVVITEEQHLQFSLQKVIDNALKFTESGSITINVKLSKISQVVEIWVIDTGCGIAEGSISSLFQPHFQEDASLSRSKDGLGLSLFNAKAHVRKKLGGDVTLERSATDGPSRGSEFLIRLPISSLGTENSDAPLIGTPTPTGRTGSWIESSPTGYFFTDANPILPGTLTGRPSPVRQPSRKTIPFNSKLARDYPLNILIAEDNAINRNVAVGSLNKLGYAKENITLAFDGTDAVQHYKASLELPESQRFDAVLMDIWMPNMDGYEATSQIMNLGKELGQETTIIAVTADITGDSVDRAKEAGMQGFLAKPYKVLDIENLIIEHFGERFERDV
jgi:CheY-like chemotaxis protein